MPQNKWMKVDVLRRTARRVMGSQSRLYRAGSAVIDFVSVARKEGLETSMTLRRLQASTAPPLPAVPVTFRGMRHPLLVRPGTEDAGMVTSTIVREEYGQFEPAVDPEWMIDAGTYIGDTSAYFLSRFPRLKVIALEPNPPAFEMARQNLAPYGGRATLLPKALWTGDQRLRFGGDFGGASIQATGCEVEATSIPSLLNEFAIPRLDILKMDIEGAEELIFASNPEGWLARVELLIIEIHGPAAQSVVFRALQQNGFTTRQYRSVWYCTRDS